MKVQFNDEVIFEISETDLSVLANDINLDSLEEDLKRRLKWVISHKIEKCEKRMKDEWIPKLMEDSKVESIPASREKMVEMICSREDYKCRKTRDSESKDI